MKVFLTGAGGFIGRNLIKKLHEQNIEVLGCDNTGGRDDIKKIFEKALNLANNVIYEKSKTSSPMGTTFVSGIIVNDKIFIANVGDSRAYMLNGDNFTQITKDNSFVQELIEEGILDEDKARTHENKNEIQRYNY